MSSTLTSCSVWMDLRRYKVHIHTHPLTCIHVHVYNYVYNLHNHATEGNLSLHYLRPNTCTCTLYVTTLCATTERYLVCTYSGYGFCADIQEYPTD